MGKTRSLVTAAFLAAVLVASKFALDGLPNIELVSLLVILYTLEYPWLAVPAVYTYVFVYGLLNLSLIHISEEVVPHQVGEIHISLHTAVGTHHLDGAVAPFGERGRCV